MTFDLLTHFGSSSGGASALGISLSGFIVQLITFIIAILILRRWAFKPIMKVLKERREVIEKGVTLGEQMEKEKAELEARVAKTLHETRAKADQIITEAQASARQVIRDAEDQARDKAVILLKDAKARSESEVKRAWHELEGQVAGLVTDATEAVIGEKVDAAKDSELVSRAVKEQIRT
ncbi:F0F1 ATP synthase subunit B [Patescibacteria group bacterium]|nr:F0F1 ATP synthase subunit B [Patescibacteria group bacterium]